MESHNRTRTLHYVVIKSIFIVQDINDKNYVSTYMYYKLLYIIIYNNSYMTIFSYFQKYGSLQCNA